MLKQSNNHQVIYSLNALSQALYGLMQEYPIEEISITQICQEAHIARRTFYRNCSNKLDLIDYLIQNQIQELLDSADFTCKDPFILYQSFLQYWNIRDTFLLTLYRNHLFDRFAQVFTRCCLYGMEDILMKEMLEGRTNQNSLRHFYISFTIGGLCNVLESWTSENFKTPVPDLVYVLATLAPKID